MTKIIEELIENININQISSASARDFLDWEHIEDMRINSKDFADVFEWVSRCLSDVAPHSFDQYTKVIEKELEIKKSEIRKREREIDNIN